MIMTVACCLVVRISGRKRTNFCYSNVYMTSHARRRVGALIDKRTDFGVFLSTILLTYEINF